MILLLVRCSVIHFCCCSLISSSPIYMSKVPVEPWKHTLPHTHTPTLVILGQPLCSFSQSSGCPSSPITVATELHPDSLQIGYVTLNAGAPTHPHFTHTLQHNTYTQLTVTNTSLKITNTETRTHKHLMNMIKRTHVCSALCLRGVCAEAGHMSSPQRTHATHTLRCLIQLRIVHV